MTKARFSPTAPIGILEDLHKEAVLGDFHLLIAPDVLKHEHRYHKLFVERRSEWDINNKGFIIIDNGVIEKDPLSAADVIKASKITKAECIVMPDILAGGWNSLQKTKEGITQTLEMDYHGKIMVVPQFLDLDDWILACWRLWEDSHIFCWNDQFVLGVPRHIGRTKGTRMPHVLPICEVGFPIHLLGFSHCLLDDLSCCRLPNVIGIDSSIPIRCGELKMDIDIPHPTWPKRNSDYFNQKGLIYPKYVAQQIERVRTYLSI